MCWGLNTIEWPLVASDDTLLLLYCLSSGKSAGVAEIASAQGCHTCAMHPLPACLVFDRVTTAVIGLNITVCVCPGLKMVVAEEAADLATLAVVDHHPRGRIPQRRPTAGLQ